MPNHEVFKDLHIGEDCTLTVSQGLFGPMVSICMSERELTFHADPKDFGAIAAALFNCSPPVLRQYDTESENTKTHSCGPGEAYTSGPNTPVTPEKANEEGGGSAEKANHTTERGSKERS